MFFISKTEELENEKLKRVLYDHLDMLFEKLESLNKKEEESNKREYPEPLNSLLKYEKDQLEKLDEINKKIEHLAQRK